MIHKILSLFKRKKIETPLVNEFALIRLTKSAKMKGITDDENKIIEHYKNGEVIRTYPYTKSNVKSLKEVDEIPVEFLDEVSEDDTDFFWEEPTDFGVSKEIR